MTERYEKSPAFRLGFLNGAQSIPTWSGVRESNPPVRLGKPTHYRCTNPAGEYLFIIPAGGRNVKPFFRLRGPLHRSEKDHILKETVKGG